MQNQKLQSFFKTILFQKNYGYIWSVIFFWLYILYIILTLLFFGDTKYSYEFKSMTYFSNLNIVDMTLILLFQPILKKYEMLDCGIMTCQISFITSIIIFLLLIIIVFLINWIIVKLFIKAKRYKNLT